MQTSNSKLEEWQKKREAAEALGKREACLHLKRQAIELSLEQDEYSHLIYAHSISSHILSFFVRHGYPERLLNASFFSFSPRNEDDAKMHSRLLRYCEAIAPSMQVSEMSREKTGLKTPSFAMYGPPGTGKTFAAVCVAKEAIWMGHRSHYTTVSSLAREVRSTFRKGSEFSENGILEKYSKTPLLIFDEIGAGTGSDHERAMFTDVISERYNAKRPTILISNLNLADFKIALGERVTDRLSEDGGFILPVLGESRRRA